MPSITRSALPAPATRYAVRNPVRPLLAAAVAAALAAGSPVVRADDTGNNSVRLGLYSVFYHAKADDLSGPYTPAGVNFDFKNVQTLYLGYVRSLPANFALELALGYPPLNKTYGRGPATVGSVPYSGQEISTARWLSPTLLLEYRFLGENSRVRPYIGVGVNYTAFYARDSTAQGDAATGGPTRLSLTSSVGPAATVGLQYHITGRWNFYTSYSVSQVKTDLTADTDGVIRRTRISFAPQALVVSFGYSF